MKPDLKVIGSRLKMLRKALGKSQENISNDLELNQILISRLEQNTGGSIENLINLVHYYGQFFDLRSLFLDEFEVLELSSKVNMKTQTAEKLKLLQSEITEIIYSLEDPS